MNIGQHAYIGQVVSMPYGIVETSYISPTFADAKDDMVNPLIWDRMGPNGADIPAMNDNMLASLYRSEGPEWHSGLTASGYVYRIVRAANLMHDED